MTMQIKLNEAVKHFDKVENRMLILSADDVVTVRDEVGAYFCEMGWAEDVAGKCPSGERKPGVVVLSPAKVEQLMG
jgi:hypothetical protein